MSPDRKEIFTLLHSFFGKDLAGRIRALTWYNANNPLLGGVSPKHMVQVGRSDKVLSFIRGKLEENGDAK
jgi:hypothetical protein